MSRSPLVAMPFLDTPAPPRADRRSRSHPAAGGSVDHPCGRSSRGAIDAFQPTAAARSPRRRRPPRGGQRGDRDVRSDGHLRRASPSLRRTGGGGEGLAWGSCGRSGRHALGRAAGASCVQRLDDSRNSAIHTTYRISLRSSSLQEPRYPLLRVVATCFDPPGGRHLSPASVVLCAPRAPPPGRRGGGRFIERPRASRHGGGGTPSRRTVGGRRPSPRTPPRGQQAAPARHLAHCLPAQARGRGAGDRASGHGPSRYVHDSRCSADVCQ